jgi:hypothetical protein
MASAEADGAPLDEAGSPDGQKGTGTEGGESKDPNDFTKKETLGEGPRSRVEVWVDKGTGDVVVAKQYSGTIDSAKFLRGARALLGLEHPSVLRTLGFVPQTASSQAALLTTHAGGFGGHGTLEGLFSKPEVLSPTQKARLIVGIAQSLKYLHEKGLVHGTLKPTNVAIDREGHAQLICNTGVFEPEKAVSNLTAPWASPEYLSRGELTAASDVWGLGLLAYQLIAGKPAFDPALKPWPLLEAVMGGVRPELPESLPDAVGLLVQRSWDVDPGVRPTAAEFFEVMSVSKFALGEGVEVGVVRGYVSKFVEGAQPGEGEEEAEQRANKQAREEVGVLKKEVGKLTLEVGKRQQEGVVLAREFRAASDVLLVVMDQIALLEAEVQALKQAAGTGQALAGTPTGTVTAAGA